MGKERLGLLLRREEMGERELRGRHLSHQHNTARPGGHDQRHHMGMALVLIGSSWALIRHRLNQGTASMRKWAPIFKSKCVNGGRKIHLMVMSVWGSVLWGSALWTLTTTMKSAIDSSSAHHLYEFWVSREVQRRRWIYVGEDSVLMDTLHTRVEISHCHARLRDSLTAVEDTWRASRRTTGLLKWSEQELFSAGDGRSSATPRSGQENIRRATTSSAGRIRCAVGTAKGARRIPGRTQGGGKTPKTVCLSDVRKSWFCVN